MKERIAISTVSRGLDIRQDALDLLSPSSNTNNSKFHKEEISGTGGNPNEGKELRDVCSLGEDSDLVYYLKANEQPKPFAGFGSYRQRNGEVPVPCTNRFNGSARKKGMSCEAPARLGSGLCLRNSGQHQYSPIRPVVTDSSLPNETRYRAFSERIDIKDQQAIKETLAFKRLQKQRSFSSDIDRDEAWERKRDLFLVDEFHDDKTSRNVGRSASDCGDRTWPRPLKGRSRARIRSLTDEDLEELRGCIDLGFGFNYDGSCDLRSTLPALDLYCVINRQYNDMKSRSSPVSPLDGISLERSSSVDSPGSPLNDTWKISSPGDHPNQVKTRLRHWAQAVACSIRQGSF